MRIVFVTNTLNVGGVETNLLRLATELRRRGHAVIVVAEDGVLRRELEAIGVKHVRVPTGWRSPLALWQASVRVRQLVRETPIDAFHVLSATGAAILALARRGQTNFPPVFSAPGGLYESPKERLWRDARLWVSTWGADVMLAISGEIERGLTRLSLPPHPRVISFCHIALDTQRFRPLNGHANLQRLREELRLPEEARVIGTIGACLPRKSHHLFLEAAAGVAAQDPHAYFLIIGDGALRPKLEALAVSLGIAERVRFTGVRHDIPELLSLLDVYMRPGVVEGFAGITALEALGVGVPTVAFETEDVKVAVIDGQTGVLVPCGDTQALARAILGLLRDPARAKALANAGRQLVYERFTTERIVDGLERLYHSGKGSEQQATCCGSA